MRVHSISQCNGIRNINSITQYKTILCDTVFIYILYYISELKMELVKGRPADTNGREEKEIRVYDLLDELGIEYYRTDHEEANTMEKCNEIDKILDTIICKNLFLCNRQKTDFYMLMMPVTSRSKQRILPNSSAAQGCRLHHLNLWRSFWILSRELFLLWG